MTSGSIAALGIGQCVNWGVLYYAFAVLLQPVHTDLGVPAWMVAAAFSLALLIAAGMAPTVGRWSDRGHAARTIQVGGLCGAALLLVWALRPTLGMLYVVWAGLGCCMAATLYEPAFALVTRAHADASSRLRALAAVTVFGGLASTVFLPLTAALVDSVGWRLAVAGLAALLLASSALTAVGARHIVGTQPSGPPSSPVDAPVARRSPDTDGVGISFLMLVVGAASLSNAAFTSNLVPALGERAVAPTTAALLGGLFGVMQLPGRVLMTSPRWSAAPRTLLSVSLGLQAAGLIVVATSVSLVAIAGGLMTYATGAGLTTLARPFLVQSAFPLERAGYVNGRLAQAQQITRAAGPVLAASLATVTGYATVLGALASAIGVLAVLAFRRAS